LGRSGVVDERPAADVKRRKKMKKLLKKFVKDERGMETVEWAVMAGLILVGLIAIVSVLGQHVATVFGLLRDEVGTAAGAGAG
jgi:Flp pilus assembly pilin Flp